MRMILLMEGGGGGKGVVCSGWKKGIGSSSLAALLVIDGGLECPILNAEITPKKKPVLPKKKVVSAQVPRLVTVCQRAKPPKGKKKVF